jgi:dipeptidase E
MNRKILLTSAGFSNKNIEKAFLKLLPVRPKDAKALFIPTAAIYPDAAAMLPVCMQDLLCAGIPNENIVTYDLDQPLEFKYAKQFHVIYFCGGDPQHLLNRIKESGFDFLLDMLLDQGTVYVGVSAGSIVAAENLPDSLHYINCKLSVHQEKGSPCGRLLTDGCPGVSLTDSQAVLIKDDELSIIE